MTGRLTITRHLFLQGGSLSLTHRRLKFLRGLNLILGPCVDEAVVPGHHAERANRSMCWDREDVSHSGGGLVGFVPVGLGDGDPTGN